MFAIVVNEKGGEQKRLEFDKPEVTIGRVQGNDIILPKGNVSKRHSRIVLKDGKFIIVDLKSTNGTYVNGRKITSPLVVKGSDKIYIGDFILSIEEVGAQQGMTAPPAEEAPSRGPKPTIPPPPPRRPSQQEFQEEDSDERAADGDDSEAASEPEAPLPPPREEPPPRPARPSAPPASALPPVRPAPAPAPRPASVVQPVGARPAPGPVPRPSQPAISPPPAARPAPLPSARPAPAPVAARKPHPTVATVDEAKRGKLTEVMRELSTRLSASLGTEASVDATQQEDLWSRAENAAGELLEQLAADGAVPPGTDTEALLKDVVAETVGTGPLEELLADENVREVTIPRFDRVFADRGSSLQLHGKWFSSPDAVARAVERLLSRAGRRADLDAAKADGLLVEARIDNGLLLTAALPPLAARGPAVTIRRPRRNLTRIADLVSEGVMSQGMADFLELALKQRRNVVISGSAGSGRSTVLAALARAVAETGARVVSVEEAEELDLADSGSPWIALIGRGAQARTAIGNAVRLRPERLVVGDVRGAEALELLAALTGGADGCIAAVQGGSPREALQRLSSMARLAAEAPAPEVIADELGRGVHVVMQLVRAADGETRVGEIAEVTPGGNGDDPGLQTVFTFKPDTAGGRFAATGHVPGWAEGAPPSTFRA